MANTDSPRGLSPVRHQSGAPFSASVNKYYVPAGDATAIYIGGLVKLAGSADADGIASVTGNVATGDKVLGVVISVEPSKAISESTLHKPGSTMAYVHVADDPDLMFEVQEDSVGGALAATSVGQVADLIGFTAGDTASGRSAIEIDSSTATSIGDGTADVVIMGLVQDGGEIGANAMWLVRLNNHAFANGGTGV